MILELKNVNKSFGEKEVLKDVSFVAEGGKAFGLLGRNGAGKTTSIRILMNVFPANSGEVLVDGKPIDHDKVGIGYLPEERGLYPKKLIIDQLVYFAELKGLSAKDAVKAVDYWLGRLGMTEYRNKRLDTLSKGNQQKIQLITALAHDPDIVILDEPFSGLDPVNTEALRVLISELVDSKKYIVMSSHQMSTVEEYCENLVLLHRGKTVLSGNLKEIKAGYGHTRLLIDAPKAAEDIAERVGLKLKERRADGLEYYVSGKADAERFLSALTEAAVFPTKFELREPSLNEIFIEKAGSEI